MGMTMAHGLASGMGGIRTAGDLVARMQMVRKMRINDAKAYVADKLMVSPRELSDPVVMREVREKLERVRPDTIGQAARIPGMTPAAISLLLIHLRKARRQVA